jgi:hypothetical protein
MNPRRSPSKKVNHAEIPPISVNAGGGIWRILCELPDGYIYMYDSNYAFFEKGAISMEELLCTIEIYKQWGECVGTVSSSIGGRREYRDKKFMEVLDQIIMDVKEEFEAGSG